MLGRFLIIFSLFMPFLVRMSYELKSLFNCNFLSFLVPIIRSNRVIEYVVERIDVKIVC